MLRRCAVLLCALSLAGIAASAAPAFAAPSVLVPGQATIDFPDHDVHDGSHPSVALTLTNSSGTDANVSGVAITGADASQFSIGSDSCSGAVVGMSGGTCEVDVSFAPTAPGAKSATLEVTDDTGVVEVPLTGEGTTGTLSASPVSFQPQPSYYGDPSAQLTITDGSSWQVQSTSWAFTGPDASRFYVQWGDNCFHQGYWPGNTCGVGIGMHAAPPGTYHAQLEVTNDGTETPLVIPLTVTELRGPHLLAAPGRVSFGDVPVGQDAARTVRITNDGDFDMQVQQAVMLTGLPDVLFAGDDSCSGAIMAPGDACQIVVHFAPNAAGPANAPLLVIGGNGSQPVTVIGVSGTGVPVASGVSTPPAAPSPPADPSPPASGGPSQTLGPTALPRGTAALTGRATVGRTLRCRPRGYASDTSFRYRWLRDGRRIAGAAAATRLLRPADQGARVACRVMASNSVGTQIATSRTSRPVSSPRGARAG